MPNGALKFEKEVISQQEHIKGAKPLRPVKKGANAAIGYAHKKIYENEHENVGIEAAPPHRAGGRGRASRPEPPPETAPYRKVSRLQKKTVKTRARAAYQQASMITCSYGAMCFPACAEIPLKKGVCQSCPDRPAHRAGCRENCRCHEKSRWRCWRFASRHPALCLMAALLFLIVVLIFSLFSSCSSMGTGGIGAIAASSYTAEDQDINNAELVYTEWGNRPADAD